MLHATGLGYLEWPVFSQHVKLGRVEAKTIRNSNKHDIQLDGKQVVLDSALHFNINIDAC